MQFRKDRWTGNRWASIDITPVDSSCFFKILAHLSSQYGFPMPKIIDLLDGYAADFEILGSNATIHIDTWTFSIAFQRDQIRDLVISELQALPEDFFESMK